MTVIMRCVLCDDAQDLLLDLTLLIDHLRAEHDIEVEADAFSKAQLWDLTNQEN